MDHFVSVREPSTALFEILSALLGIVCVYLVVLQTFLFEITASPEAIIGRYSISIKIADATTSKTTKSKQEFILIFNPWAVNDDVYMSGELVNERGASSF